MPSLFDLSNPEEVAKGLRQARVQIGRKQVVVIPTDSGYGLAANAFSPGGVARLGEVKRWMEPVAPQVLIPGFPTLTALAAEVPEAVRALVEEFWPGGLTVIVHAQPSLQWDLGDNRGTVALRMPAHPIAGELLAEVGPMVVSAATRDGHTPGSIDEIVEIFGEEVACYLIDPSVTSLSDLVPSTVVDATGLGTPGGHLRILRSGEIDRDALEGVVGDDAFGPELSSP